VKDSPGANSVTVHVVVGSLGWRMRTRDPTRRSPSSRRRTELTDAVHSGQRSTSHMTSHTRGAGAAIATTLSAYTAVERTTRQLASSPHEMILSGWMRMASRE
jgi:hypothetical protein